MLYLYCSTRSAQQSACVCHFLCICQSVNMIDENDLLLIMSKTMSIHVRSKEAMKLNTVKTIVECGVP